MSYGTGIPAVDRLGEELERALRHRRRARRPARRHRRLLPAVIVAAVLAVPAAATKVDWAAMVGGQTALPSQAPPDRRVPIAHGTTPEGPWTLVGYRAQIAAAGGAVGTCVFLTTFSGGAGRCFKPAGLPALTLVSDGAYPAEATVGLTRLDADAIEVRYHDGGRQTVLPSPVGSSVAARLRLPAATQLFVVPSRRRSPAGPSALRALRDGQVVGTYP